MDELCDMKNKAVKKLEGFKNQYRLRAGDLRTIYFKTEQYNASLYLSELLLQKILALGLKQFRPKTKNFIRTIFRG